MGGSKATLRLIEQPVEVLWLDRESDTAIEYDRLVHGGGFIRFLYWEFDSKRPLLVVGPDFAADSHQTFWDAAQRILCGRYPRLREARPLVCGTVQNRVTMSWSCVRIGVGEPTEAQRQCILDYLGAVDTETY